MSVHGGAISAKFTDKVVSRGVPAESYKLAKHLSPSTPRETKYWSDEAYAKFCSPSLQERSALSGGNVSTATGKNLEKIVATRLTRGKASDTKNSIVKFQQAFAEYSVGKEWLHVGLVRRLLKDLGLSVDANSIDLFMKELRDAGGVRPVATERLSYDEALELYLRADMPTPPSPEHLVRSAMHAAVDDLAHEALDAEQVLPPGPPWSAAVVLGPRSLGSPRPEGNRQPLNRAPVTTPRQAALFKRVGRFTLDPLKQV